MRQTRPLFFRADFSVQSTFISMLFYNLNLNVVHYAANIKYTGEFHKSARLPSDRKGSYLWDLKCNPKKGQALLSSQTPEVDKDPF